VSERPDLRELGFAVREHGRVEQRVACPRCGKHEREDTVGINVVRGLWHCFRCGWKGRLGAIPPSQWANPIAIDDPRIAERKRERLRAAWAAAVPLSDPDAHPHRRYLESRALGPAILTLRASAVRAHHSLPYWHAGRLLGEWPALLALVRNGVGDPVTLHATYLRSSGTGKAQVPTARKLLPIPVRGATKGAAIHLHPGAATLGIAEGIESALSLHLLVGVPVWAAGCADALERVRLPSFVRELYIGVDLDENGRGEAAAQALAHRVSAWRSKPAVHLVAPDGRAPRDLNDELRAGRGEQRRDSQAQR
jgi:ribosomal protein L37AE/L43A